MTRHVAAIAVALCLCPSWLCAQSTVFIVNTIPANVYKTPSTGSQVIGKAPRGAELEVTRELGSWVKVVWPDAQDGAGYLHVSSGSTARAATPAPNPAAGLTSARPAIASASPPATAALPEHSEAGEPAASTRTVYVRPPTHLLGVGGRMGGPSLGFGATARAWPWPKNRYGIQFDMSRYGLDTPGHLASSQFSASLLYSLRDRLTDYLWVRPYLGAGSSLQRQTLNLGTAGSDARSDTRLGFQAFGGGEVAFAGAPRFTLSADFGYQWLPTSFAGFELGGLGLSMSGHWYIK